MYGIIMFILLNIKICDIYYLFNYSVYIFSSLFYEILELIVWGFTLLYAMIRCHICVINIVEFVVYLSLVIQLKKYQSFPIVSPTLNLWFNEAHSW